MEDEINDHSFGIEAEDAAATDMDLQAETSSNGRRTQRCRVYFLPSHDITLLTEALAKRAFIAERGKSDLAWKKVELVCREKNIHADFRALRDRFNLLVKKYIGNERKGLRKSGTNDEYVERERLLQAVVDFRRSLIPKMSDDKKSGPATTSLKRKDDNENDMCNDDASQLDSSCGSEKRPRNSSITLQFEKEKLVRVELENERLRLTNEREKLAIEREKVQLEHERLRIEEKRLEWEAKEKEQERQAKMERSKQKSEFLLELIRGMRK